MRYYIIALILQSVSLSVAKLESYQTPHVSEDLKSFRCDGRIYDSHKLQSFRNPHGRFENENVLNTEICRRFSQIASAQDPNQKLIYVDDSSTNCSQLHLTHIDRMEHETIQDYIVHDSQSRVCAVITINYSRGRDPQENFCQFVH
ncbi:Bgt-20369 [Blumeria graminis f. sp. tritici]|uniref:Bgt-20369 n=2 Tax=Blumeria graminis f. sp. tritici TaxID=62690 RepID=A0A9X9L913_BLUGR|nr:Bgt-20369 [Blumeria graminis f. sp. tritici]